MNAMFSRLRSIHTLLAIVLLPLATTACVPKGDLEEAEVQVANCQDEKAQLQAEVTAWEERFDRESSRWTDMQASITDTVPAALNEFHAERKRILEMVPEQVQSEVETYLNDYFATVMRGVEMLSKDNADIKLQLQASSMALQALGKDTRSINTKIDTTLAEERARQQAVQRRIDDVAGMLADTINEIKNFDQTRINCKTCPERLKLNRKEREALLGFHAELTSALADLQAPPPMIDDGGDSEAGEHGAMDADAEAEGEVDTPQ